MPTDVDDAATVVVEESRQCEGVAAALHRFEASVPYGAGKPWKGGVADRGAALRAKVAREAVVEAVAPPRPSVAPPSIPPPPAANKGAAADVMSELKQALRARG